MKLFISSHQFCKRFFRPCHSASHSASFPHILASCYAGMPKSAQVWLHGRTGVESCVDESLTSMSSMAGLFSTLNLLKVDDNKFGDALFIGACLSVLEYVYMLSV